MLYNFRRVPTLGLDGYVSQLPSSSTIPCGKLLSAEPLESVIGSTRNVDERPITLQCGDSLRGGMSAVCFDCFDQYNYQVNGEAESIPLRGLVQAEEAERYSDASKDENKLVRFVKNHPLITAGVAALFACGVIGSALGAYKSLTPTASASVQAQSTDASSTATSSSANSSTTTAQSTTTTELALNQSTTVTEPSTTQTTKLTQPTTTESITTKPTTTKPTTTKPVTTKSVTTKPVTTKPATTTQPIKVEPTTAKPATTQAATNQSTIAKTEVTQAATTQAPAAKPTPVREIKVRIINYKGAVGEVAFEVCDPTCSSVGAQIPYNTRTLSRGIDSDGFKSASIKYSFRGEALKSSLDNTVFPDKKIQLANRNNIQSLDKNRDGKLEIRHTLLHFASADRLDQAFEDASGVAEYPGVTIAGMKMVLDNRWQSGAAYFSINAKGVEQSYQFKNVRAWNFAEKSFPVGIHEIDMDLGYGERKYTGQELSKALADSKNSHPTVCVTAGYNKPTYLSDVKHGRCGR